MAALTAATAGTSFGNIKVFTFSAIGDGDTFAGPPNPKGYICQITADPTTNTSSGCNVAHSSGTYTFYPGVAALSGTLIVIV